MKLLLINLSLRPDSPRCIFPIGLGYIATAIKHAGFEFDLLDMDLNKQKPMDLVSYPWHKYDVIAFGCIVTGYRIVKELASIIKLANPNACIICGNTVASSIPNALLQNTDVDVAVLGEGDKAIVELLHYYLEYGFRKGMYRATTPLDINAIPMLDWGIFDIATYIERNRALIPEPYPLPYADIKAMPLNTARGCLFRCTFCYHAFQDYRYRYRSIDSITKEIDMLKDRYGINYITFYDDLTLFNKQRAMDFAKMLTNKGVFWTACCRADLFSSGEGGFREALQLKDSGCVALGYSLESANAGILAHMNKRISLEGFARQKEILDKVGIATVTSIVLGYPEETEATIKETFDFCYDNGIYPSTGFLQPYPGTPMYNYALHMGFIEDEEAYRLQMGDRQDLHLNMTKLSDEELQGLVLGHLKRIRDKLKLPLTDEQLIKTGVVRQGAK